MPIYEYQCAACGERLERLQRMSEPPLVECPTCGEPALRRLLSTPAFQFKGSGWYVTDYARKGGEKGKEKEGGEAKGGDVVEAGQGDKGKKDTKETKDKKDTTPAKKVEKAEP